MNKQWPCVLWLALLLFSSGAQTPPNAAGRWTGGIELSGVKLGFSVDLAQKARANGREPSAFRRKECRLRRSAT